MTKTDTSSSLTKSASPLARWFGWPDRHPAPEDDFFAPFGFNLERREFGPRVGVVEGKKKVTIEVELPGMEKDEVEVSAEHGAILIEGVRQDDQEESDGEGLFRRTSRFGSFYRVVPLGFEVSAENIKAKLRNGLLTIVVPRPAGDEETGKTVAVH